MRSWGGGAADKKRGGECKSGLRTVVNQVGKMWSLTVHKTKTVSKTCKEMMKC